MKGFQYSLQHFQHDMKSCKCLMQGYCFSWNDLLDRYHHFHISIFPLLNFIFFGSNSIVFVRKSILVGSKWILLVPKPFMVGSKGCVPVRKTILAGSKSILLIPKTILAGSKSILPVLNFILVGRKLINGRNWLCRPKKPFSSFPHFLISWRI